MFVICDVNWVQPKNAPPLLTQIAAIRVNANWGKTDSFFSYCKLKNNGKYNWTEKGFIGGTAKNYINALNPRTVLARFGEWLEPDDILLWWDEETCNIFMNFHTNLLHTEACNKSIIISPYISNYLHINKWLATDYYTLAFEKGITTKSGLKHFTKNNVKVLQKLLKTIELSPEALLLPLKKAKKETYSKYYFFLDTATLTLHNKECSLTDVHQFKTIGQNKFVNYVHRGYNLCPCCKADYRKALAEKNADILARCNYAYVYSDNSDIYHKPDCRYALRMKSIKGAEKLETVLKSGKIPCKVCNAGYNYENPDDMEKATLSEQVYIVKGLPEITDNNIQTAIKRHVNAVNERHNLLKNNSLSDRQKKDIYTLTDPGYAFWSSKGHRSFHLRNCKLLENLVDLRAFHTYGEARHAGFTPCRKCKPTDNHDIKLFIPIESRIKEKESVYDILSLCDNTGFKHYLTDNHIHIETDVGKWKIATQSIPVIIKHINLVLDPFAKEYHQQPSAFLSMEDAFYYIVEHDTILSEKKKQGRAFIRYFNYE